MNRRQFLQTLGTVVTGTTIPAFGSLLASRSAFAACPYPQWTDYAFVPGAASGNQPSASEWEEWAWRYFDRRPNTELIYSGKGTVQSFIQRLSEPALEPCVTLPVGTLFIVSHATPDGWFSIRMDDTHPDPLGPGRYGSVEYTMLEDMAKVAEASPAKRSTIFIPDQVVNPRPPGAAQARVRIVGCQLGDAVPFIQLLKTLFGPHVTVRAPRYYDFFADGFQGSLEYFAYRFSVTTLAPKGFVNRADLIKAYQDRVAARHKSMKLYNGSFPSDDSWNKWLPKGKLAVTPKPQPTHLPVKFNPPVEGLPGTTLEPDPGYNHFVEPFGPYTYPDAQPADRASETTRRNFMKRHFEVDPFFKGAFPVYKRKGEETLDEFLAAFDWWPQGYGPWERKVGKKLEPNDKVWRGYRNSYTLLVPVTNDNQELFYNYVGPTGGNVHEGLEKAEADSLFTIQ